MLRRLGRLVVVLVASLAIAALTPAIGRAGSSGAPLSDDGCEAFNDYFQVNFAIAFLTSFAEAFEDLDTSNVHRTGTTSTSTTLGLTPDDTGFGDDSGDDADSPDIDQLRNLVFLVLSPKLEQATSVLAKEAPRNLRRVFAQQRDVYREGIELLRDDVGLTDEQIEEIRDTDFDEEQPASLAEDLGIDEADLEAAAEEFGEKADVLTAADATEAQSRGFERLAVGCGAVPDSSLDCDTLVSEDLRDDLLGGSATVSNDDGTCTYTVSVESEDGEDEDEAVLAVDVYRTADAYDRIVTQNDSAEEIDDDNATLDGFATFSSFKTCGRTLFSEAEDATVVVALCLPDDATVSDGDLTDVRDEVVASL